MRARFLLIMVLAVFGLCSLQGTAVAAITKCKFDVFTTNESGKLLRVDFYLELEDSTLPPPEAFSVVKITAPDGSVFDYSTTYWKYWTAGSRYFFFCKFASDFPGQAIPTGTYKLTVTDKSTPARTVINWDSLSNVTPLPLVTLTYPQATNPQAVVPLNATLSWTPVTGALYYRIFLTEESGNKEFVYDGWKHNPMWVYGYKTTTLALPKGALAAGRSYAVRIEARDSDKNVSRRSRTPFVYFQTAP